MSGKLINLRYFRVEHNKEMTTISLASNSEPVSATE